MQTIYRLVALVVIVTLTGCATTEQMQLAMNEIDQRWGSIGRKIIADKGSRTLAVSTEQAKRAVTAGLTSLGFERTKETSTRMIFKARSPAPFSEAEYQHVRIVEEPIMQAMASNYVGSLSASLFVLSSNDTYTIVQVLFDSGGPGTTVVRLDFELEWINGREQWGLLLGENPPPEAVRLGTDKLWKSISAQL